MNPDIDLDPEITYTREERIAMNKRAREAARKEWEADLNRTDPKHTQDRVEAALFQLRQQMGLEK